MSLANIRIVRAITSSRLFIRLRIGTELDQLKVLLFDPPVLLRSLSFYLRNLILQLLERREDSLLLVWDRDAVDGDVVGATATARRSGEARS